MAEPSTPWIHVIAGPNGAGKTTFARRFLPHYAGCLHFLNADLIAAGLSPFAPDQASVTAGRLLLSEIRRLGEQREDFAFETTLAGRGYKSLLQRFKDEGYRLRLYFLWLPRVGLALQRIADRVRQGGHNVPAEDVRRRYHRGVHNFFHDYRPLWESWIVFDNSGSLPRVIALESAGATSIVDAEAYRQFTEAAKP